MMKYTLAGLAVLVMLNMMAGAAEDETVPYGPPPLLNGIEGDTEWNCPGVLDWGSEEVLIRTKQDSLYIYISVSGRDTAHSGIDLYLDDMDGGVRMFHVSSAHGERRMDGGAWGETTWGPPNSWSSNVVESIFEDGKLKFLRPDIFEFQICKSELPSQTFKLMLHLKRPERWVPAEVDTLSSQNWIEFRLR